MSPTTKLPIIALLALSALSAAQAQVPSILNYQGRVTVGGTNFNGTGKFKFALVRNDNTFVWRNDGATNGGEPATAVEALVQQGLYSTLLGDTALSNMAAIPAEVFTNSHIGLRVWFSAGESNPFVLLMPDQRIGSAGYALRAAAADAAVVTNVAGSLTVSGTLTAGQIISGSSNTADGNFAAVGGGQNNAASGAKGSVGGGENNLVNGGHGTVAGGLDNTAGDVAAVGGGYLNKATGTLAAIGGGWGNSNAGFASFIGAGQSNVVLTGATNGAVVGGLSNTVGGYASFIGGGTFNRSVGLSAAIGGGVANTNTGYASTIGGGELNATRTNYATVAGGYRNAASATASSVAGGYLNSAGGDYSVVAGGEQNFTGQYYAAVGGGAQNAVLGMYGTVPGGFQNMATNRSFAAGTRAKAIHANSFVWNSEINTDFSSAKTNSFSVNASGGAWFSHDVSVATLTIRGGADLAEPFETEGLPPEPGTVMVIDEKHPGRLKPSAFSYDTKVAGVVSGAHGIRPGITARQEGRLDRGSPIALTGRVYVKADADYGVILPGDLLVTSETPGHAMRADDRARANGAILGKAMTSLDSGRGEVLILVGLQ